MQSKYDWGLDKNEANYRPLTPLEFIKRAADVHPERIAIVHGNIKQSWKETYRRTLLFASALKSYGIKRGDTVSMMLPNVPAMVEAHFGVPFCGAVLNTLNIRLDAETISFMLQHGESKVIFVDPEFAEVVGNATRRMENPPIIIDVYDEMFDGEAKSIGEIEYEDFLAKGDINFLGDYPEDEWESFALNYTSGTTGNPKGVVYSHRGAYLTSISNILEWDLPHHPVYLWTLPMFHCNGWTFPWVLAARAGVNICLRKVGAEVIFKLIKEHQVTHYCGAPIVHNMLVNADDEFKKGINHKVNGFVAGAAPPAALLEGMSNMGFDITHVYGLTEVYGPASVCTKQESWEGLPIGEQAKLNARQGVTYHLQSETVVLDPESMEPVPRDGETMGEIFYRGNITMKGYLKNPEATSAAFRGGYFHTGDLAVIYPDGYIKIKDRSKDIIISGGENISSIEVEDVLYQHSSVMLAGIVAKPDEKWGESVCAFIELKKDAKVTEEEIIAHCKQHLPSFKVPKTVIFGELPKTATGKIQKFELRKRMNTSGEIDV